MFVAMDACSNALYLLSFMFVAMDACSNALYLLSFMFVAMALYLHVCSNGFHSCFL